MFASVQSELNQVTVFLEKLYRFKSGHLAQLVPDFRLSEADQHLRPALVLLAGKLFPQHSLDSRQIVMGGISQLIFMAQEIHNKITDDCPKSVPQFPVLVGDYLFAVFCKKLYEHDLLEWLDPLADVICRMNEGGMARRRLIEEGSPREEDYLQVLKLEYGLLTGLSCRIGGHLAGCTREQEEDLAQFGLRIGMAWGMMKQEYPINPKGFLEKGREILASFPFSQGREALLDFVDELEQMSIKLRLTTGSVPGALAT